MKSKYRLSNWSEYNKALKQRGSLNIWIGADVLENWYQPKTGRNGAPRIYSDQVFVVLQQIRSLFDLPLRQLTGFVESLIERMNVVLDIPDYTTISRRMECGKQVYLYTKKNEDNEEKTIIIDGSGLKVFGESEWKVKKHGYSKRRTWKKIHISVTPDGELQVVDVTGSDKVDADPDVIGNLLGDDTTISKVITDGGYDYRSMYQYCIDRNIILITPPRMNAVSWDTNHPRTKAFLQIKRTSLEVWKNLSGYHTRSVVENTFYRFKTIFGQHLRSRNFENQKAEVRIKCRMLNIMWSLGVPESYRVS